MLNGYKFRLYPNPNPEQEQILLQWIGCQRLIYNAKVQEDRYFRRFAQRMVGTAGEKIPVDQEYSRFITEKTAFLKQVPSQILRNGAVKFKQAYSRFFQKLGGRPKVKKKTGRQSVWLTKELFTFTPQIDPKTDDIRSYQLTLGTDKFPVGTIAYVAHRSHAVPTSIHIAVEGGHWWLSFAAEDPAVAMPEKTVDAATERIAEDLRHLSVEQLTERTLGGDRGVAKPLTTSDGQVFDLKPIQKTRIGKARHHRKQWQRMAARRKKCVFRSQLTGNPESREHLVRKVVNTQSGKSLTPGPENREHPVRKIVNSETEIFRMLFLLYSLRRSLARAGSGIFPPRVAAWPSLAA